MRNPLEQELVEAVVAGEFGVEGRREEGALAGGHGGAVGEAGQHLDSCP